MCVNCDYDMMVVSKIRWYSEINCPIAYMSNNYLPNEACTCLETRDKLETIFKALGVLR